MTTPAEYAADYYAQFKPGAVAEARQYVLSRTPEPYQALVSDLIETDLNPPPDPLIASVHDGETLSVEQWDGSFVPGTVTVADGAVAGTVLTVVATKAIVAHGGPVIVQSLADAAVLGSPGTATVAGGALTKVNLTV